ncbi:MAG: M48 family metallopeptidase [Pseudohongiellaceae bacterium]
MNFFESQDVAKRNTGRLIALFALAVIALIVITNLLVMVIFGLAATPEGEPVATQLQLFDWEVFLAIGLGVSAVVLFGSLYKMASLRGGGARVAEMMNGRLLVAETDDFNERRILNVVEEMAIASGTPVPPVYVLEEQGINAFAAGYSPSDAVIGISRGAMETLSRDQLQGVIAHEFSHILHGDMRINIRLIGVLHGIMVLGIIGYYLLRGGAHARRSKDSGGIVMLGLGLVVIGFVGTFFGNLIKAAVSRQREYLADASAVQFTRNPEGIGGALMQIAQHSKHSYLEHPGSREINHALFEEPAKLSFRGLYATHPPLAERISAILPNWDGSYDLIHRPPVQEAEPGPDSGAMADMADNQEQDKRAAALGVLSGGVGVLAGGAMIDHIGQPQAQHLAYAGSVLAALPGRLLSAAREPSAARALIYLLVLDESAPARSAQLEHLQKAADAGVYQELNLLLKESLVFAAEQRLPLVELALPSLRQLSEHQYQLFKTNFDTLIALDNKINLFEWCLQKFLFHHLAQAFSDSKPAKLGRTPLARCQQEVAMLLAVVSHSHKERVLDAGEVFARGAAELDMDLAMPALKDLSYSQLDAALERLATVKPLQKPALLKACAACRLADDQVAPIEVELLRTVAAILDCPMPPLVPQNS